jgi:hypothetical protein
MLEHANLSIHLDAFSHMYMLDGIVQFRQLCNSLGNCEFPRQFYNGPAIVQFKHFHKKNA